MSGHLFEGKLKKNAGEAIPVQVLWYPTRLVVHYIDAFGVAQTQSWQMDRLTHFQRVSKEAIIIQYGEHEQSLEVVSEQFVKAFKPPFSAFEKWIYRFKNSGAMMVMLLLGIVSLVAIVGYFFLLPLFINKAAAHIPQKYEVQLGEQMYQAFLQGQAIDTGRTKLANKFLKQMDFQTVYPLQVTIIRSEVVNAFAMPGGHVVIYSQLLKQMKGYSELAALLGHEVGHVKCRHSTKHVFQSLSTYLTISVLFGDLSGISGAMIENAGKLNELSYSRDLETEADEVGFQTLVHNQINPQGMPDLFHRLQEGNESSANIPEFLSTHPVTESRLLMIEKEIQDKKPAFQEKKELSDLFEQIKITE